MTSVRRVAMPKNPVTPESSTRGRDAEHSMLGARSERGNTIIEFSFVALLLFTLILGLLDLGRGVWVYNTLAYATRRGARYAVVHGSTSDSPADAAAIKSVIANSAVGLGSEDIQVAVTWTPDKTPGSVVQIQVQYPFKLVTAPIVISQNTLTLSANSRMVIAY